MHVFTALGAVCGLLAALAAFEGAWERMFVWLGLALFIDGIDGSFARLVRVGERLPRFSGERLDLVVDYVTYVFVPALALVHAGFLEGSLGLVLAALILLSSLFTSPTWPARVTTIVLSGFLLFGTSSHSISLPWAHRPG